MTIYTEIERRTFTPHSQTCRDRYADQFSPQLAWTWPVGKGMGELTFVVDQDGSIGFGES